MSNNAQHITDVLNQLNDEYSKKNLNLEPRMWKQFRSVIEFLQQQESMFRQAINTAVDSIILIDTQGIILTANQATTRLLGYTPEELMGKNVKKLMPPHIKKEHDTYISNYLNTKQQKVIGTGREVQGLHKNGSLVDLFLSVSEIVVSDKTFFAGILHDISKQNKVLNQLAISEETNKGVINTAVDAIIVLSDKGIVQSSNLATSRLFGYGCEELMGKNISILMPEPFRSQHDMYLKRYIETGNANIIGKGREVTALKKNGETFLAHLSVSQVLVGQKRLFTGIIRDVTLEKKQAKKIHEANLALKSSSYLKDQVNALHVALQGEVCLEAISEKIILYFERHFPLLLCAIFSVDNQKATLTGQYCLDHQSAKARQSFKIKEGIIGQVLLDGRDKEFNNIQNHDFKAHLSMGPIYPLQIKILAIKKDSTIVGILELGFSQGLNKDQSLLINEIKSVLGVAFDTANSRVKLQKLLTKTQSQEEKLRLTNEELVEKAKMLQISEEELKNYSEELRAANEALQDKVDYVERQQREIEIKNTEITAKSEALEKASKYKSEFLANISHELRTPLNSLMLLSSGLLKNTSQNLSHEQIEDIRIIKRSGENLLSLINDVLDLSKVEAGKLDISITKINFEDLEKNLRSQFNIIAKQKNNVFAIESKLPENFEFYSDFLRLEQIMNNLLSNSFKFTDNGHVILKIQSPKAHQVHLTVCDSGIGIPEDKQIAIFEAFQQVDGTNTRKYGGTGLGLAICRQLTALLNGTITLVTSKKQQGSIFKVDLHSLKEAQSCTSDQPLNSTKLKTKKAFLIIEDNKEFAKALSKVAQDNGYNHIIAHSGQQGIQLAKQIKPHAIILDIGLPDINGNDVAKHIKEDKDLRHIPIFAITGKDIDTSVHKNGILSILKKPISENTLIDLFNSISQRTAQPTKNILIVDSETKALQQLNKILKKSNITINTVSSGKKALALLKQNSIDCLITEYALEDMTALELLKKIDNALNHELPPTIIFTKNQLSEHDYMELHQYTDRFVLKGKNSMERLIDEVSFFLKTADLSDEDKLSSSKKNLSIENSFKNKSILLVDDDLRNCFSLSKQLRSKGIDLIIADSGKTALSKLQKSPKIDMILTDVMMPEMDGYEFISKIRLNPIWDKVPIIALTAKVMPEDKNKCLKVGACDYVPKPINFDILLHVMQAWIET